MSDAPLPDNAPAVPGYEILGELGRGGMGVVYRARQKGLNRVVALKMVLHAQHTSLDERERFRREAEAVARLAHPNVVQVYEVGEHRGLPFLSLEFCAGGTLAERLDGTPWPPRPAARLVEQLASAVNTAHTAGIVHRDLKPGNVLLTPSAASLSGEPSVVRLPSAPNLGNAERRMRNAELKPQEADASPPIPHSPLPLPHSTDCWTPKVSDFGLAKDLTSTGRTVTGAVVGTPSYMAPEQARGQNRAVGPLADTYALGAILYELLTGRPPFKGTTIHETLLQVVGEEPVPPSQLQRGCRGDLETICLKCLQKDPARRYASALALAEDLRRYQAGEPIKARPVGLAERGWRWCRRNPWSAGMVALTAALLVAVAGVSLFAYFDAAAHNVEIDNKRQEAEKARKEAEKAQKVAKQRLDQSLQALALFATDFRLFCEDALMPGQRKARLYETLIKQLERQIGEDAGEASEDSLRNRSWMYQTIAIVYLDTQARDKAKVAIDKGLKTTDHWLRLKPGDAYALSFRAAFLSLKGDLLWQKPAEAKALYLEVLKLRRQLTGNQAVDQFTPGRSLMQLADTLDKMHQYEESLKLREQVCKLQVEKGVEPDKLFESLDFWAWTCWKAYLGTDDEAKKKVYLEKADELSRRTLQIRPGSRRTLERWTGIARELGDREYNLAKLAEAKKNRAEAKQHSEAAQKYYQQLAAIARQLAVAPELMYSLSNYGRSFYALGLMQHNLGKHAEARASFQTSRQIREQILRDYANSPYKVHLQIDLLFSLVALGEHARAVREADAIQSQPLFIASPGAQSILYRLACIYSLSVAAVEDARGPRSLTEEDKKLQATYKDKALKALEQSHVHGNRDFRTTRWDADLISIRDDPRFQKVLELEKKQKK